MGEGVDEGLELIDWCGSSGLKGLVVDQARKLRSLPGTVGNLVLEAMLMGRGESSHGYRKSASGPASGRS